MRVHDIVHLKHEVGFTSSQFNASEGEGYVNVTVAVISGVLRDKVHISFTTDTSTGAF